MKKRVLLVDDEPRVRASLKTVLEPTYEILEAADAAEGIRTFKHDAPDLVLLDVILPGADGLSALQTMRTENRAVPVIMLTGTKAVKTAVDAMKLGAADYLSKPFDVEELQIVIERTLGKQQLEQEVRQLRAQVVQRYAFHNLIGKSPAMQEIYAKIEQVADSRTTVLVTGESGTGKELVAKAIHYNSNRRDRPFVALNCAALPETLIESELFGHKKGAFTDARQDRAGRFEEADGGTLFLDEIGELPLELQPKLLRALERREVRRIGDDKVRQVNVRIVAATNRSLSIEVERGRFREDLYHRLAEVVVQVPALRHRPEDIPVVARFLETKVRENHPGVPPLPENVLQEWRGMSFPGNVRELRNRVRLALLLGPERQTFVENEDPPKTTSDLEVRLDEPMFEGFERLKEAYEKAYLQKALEKTGNNVTHTAELAGVGRRYVQRAMERYGLREDR